MARLTFAIDYDDTYTADPELFDRLIIEARSRGHTVVIATMRHEFEPVQLGCTVDRIIYTNRKAKKLHLMRLGIEPNIWIDDRPDFILGDAVPKSIVENAQTPFWDDTDGGG